MSLPSNVLQLPKLGRKRVARIFSIGGPDEQEAPSQLSRKLRDLGFEEDREVEILHTGPFGSFPIAVRIGRSVFAMRKAEAEHITVIAS